MKKENRIIFLLLIICLWIYTLYRPNTILINQLWEGVGWNNWLETVKGLLHRKLPLPGWVIFNLPEALWIFALTVCIKPFFLFFRNHTIGLYGFPIVYVIFLECMQGLKITNGTFDGWDVFFSFVAWLTALIIPLGSRYPSIHLFTINKESIRLLIVFVIVLLAHFSGD